jgi:hypothetical protein
VDPQPFGDDHPSSFMGALYSADMPNTETSHDDYRSLDDLTRTHRAGVAWSAPVHVPSVRLRWRAGWSSQRFRVVYLDWQGWQPACEWAAAGQIEERIIDREVLGVAIEQAPGGGPKKAPGTLRLAALSLPGPGTLRVHRQGVWHTPQMPLAEDGSRQTVLDISDADRLAVSGERARISLDLIHAGGVGDPAQLTAWLSQPTLLSVDGAPVPCARWLDTRHCDPVGGWCRVVLEPAHPVVDAEVHLPVGIHATGLIALGDDAPSGAHVAPSAAAPPSSINDHPDTHTLAAAERVTHPLQHAASLGRPGDDARIGLLPSGRIAVRLGVHAHVLHLAVAIDGIRVDADWRHTGFLQRTAGPLTVSVDPRGIRLDAQCAHEAQITLYVSAREGLWPRAIPLAPFGLSFSTPDSLLDGIQWTRRARHLSLYLHHEAGQSERLARLTMTAPPGFQRRLDRLLEEAALFVQADSRVCYGLFPSVYADAIFGLEEDYLFRGLAFWGAGTTGLSAFRRTYLTPRHLDKRHYLHDLRNGLTPWQLWHLMRLTDTPAHALTPGEIELLRSTATWTLEQRERTADATGEVVDGFRVFPGLLPPFRYGGDLDFPTQSLYVNAANWCGLRAVAALTGDDHAEALADYRQAIIAAFEAVWNGSTQPLHSGGKDPGEYYQLMACGIFDPLDFFPPDHPIARRIDAQVEREGRLFSQLPRFDGWGAAPGIDAVYCHGYLINALRRGQVDIFHAGLCGLFAHAFDRELFTAREVGPIQIGRRDDGHWLPGRRLSRSEPCVGSVGVALMLLRHALVTEMGPNHLRCFGGLLPEWRTEALSVEAMPTLYGPVSLAWRPGQPPRIDAPAGCRIEWVDADGQVHPCS